MTFAEVHELTLRTCLGVDFDAELTFSSRTKRVTALIHDLLFLPISTIESRVSLRVVTHSRGLFTLEWTHPAIQACLFHTTMAIELS